MGSWGYRAFENDTAQDWLANLRLKPVLEKTIEYALASGSVDGIYLGVDEMVAALQLAAAFADDMLGGAFRLSPEKIEQCFAVIKVDDGERGWRDLAARRREMRKLKRQLLRSVIAEKIIRSPRISRRRKPPKHKRSKRPKRAA